MKIIIYNSKTGFALKYAKWLGEDLNIEVKSLKEIKKVNLKDYDQVIFSTSIFANMLRGYKKLSKKTNNIIVLAVGYTPMDGDYAEQLKAQNNVKELFYVRGGINYEKLGFMSRALIKKVTNEPVSIDQSNKDYLNQIKEFLLEKNNEL